MNYTFNASAFESVQQSRSITDAEIFSQYCSSYFQTLPLISWVFVLGSISLMALLGDRLFAEDWKARIWSALVFMYYMLAVGNVAVLVMAGA